MKKAEPGAFEASVSFDPISLLYKGFTFITEIETCLKRMGISGIRFSPDQTSQCQAFFENGDEAMTYSKGGKIYLRRELIEYIEATLSGWRKNVQDLLSLLG